MAEPPLLPPLNDPPAAGLLPGKVVWADLVAPDVDAARKFYGELLGWSYRTLEEGGRPYTLAYRSGLAVAGMIQRRGDDARDASGRWIGFVSVADVPAAVARTTQRGGRVLVEGRVVPDRGEMALLADPDDVPFGVLRSASGDREDLLADYGEWIWALYQGPAAASAAAFYQDLAGYEVVPDDRYFDVPHYLLVSGGYARASVVEIAADRPRLRPGWLHFVRVADVQAALARIPALGGRVLVAPRADLAQGRIAVVADPGGAPLGLMAWDAAPEERAP